MKTLTIALLLALLAGCEDHYRYRCQDPDQFQHPDCQKPKCLFTQQCPEYLVAPILEKQVDAAKQPSSSAAPNR